MRQRWDTIIIGAGPAGLMAAVYLARYRRSTLVLHDGRSRAACIPLTHNAPGWT
jgi:thioredoxin reductase (NADPH)